MRLLEDVGLVESHLLVHHIHEAGRAEANMSLGQGVVIDRPAAMSGLDPPVSYSMQAL